MAGVSRQRTGIPGRDALDDHAARAALAVEVRLPAPSLRANGSAPTGRANARPMTGAAPPDDRLREAIHSFFTRQDGLLRCARNDGRKTGAPNLQPSHTSLALLSANDHTRRMFSRGIKLRMTGVSARSTGSQVVVKRSTPSDSSAVKRPYTSM